MKFKTSPWTHEEIQRLRASYCCETPHAVIARELNRSVKSVEKKITSEGLAADKPKETEKEAHWRKEAARLSKLVEKEHCEKTAVDVLVERATELAPVSYQPAPFQRAPSRKPKSQPQSAVLIFSDTHIGQCISPDQTLGLGGYSFDIFLRRLKRLERSVFSIVQDHTTTEIPEIVVAMIGDMIHGNLNHAAEASQHNTLFTQFYSAGHAIAQFLRNLSTLAPIRVVTAVGNHPRWGTQKKMPTENRYSNLDQFLYAYTAALTRDIPTIKWNLDAQPFALFDVQGHHFYAGHGDHLRGGDKMLGIPNHAVGRNVSTTTQLFVRAGMPVPNYYLFGHFHRPITLPHATGEVIINGGFPGVDGFGLMNAFNPSFPLQKFFLVHPKFGRSACYDLRLDFAEKDGPVPYDLPTGFPCK